MQREEEIPTILPVDKTRPRAVVGHAQRIRYDYFEYWAPSLNSEPEPPRRRKKRKSSSLSTTFNERIIAGTVLGFVFLVVGVIALVSLRGGKKPPLVAQAQPSMPTSDVVQPAEADLPPEPSSRPDEMTLPGITHYRQRFRTDGALAEDEAGPGMQEEARRPRPGPPQGQRRPSRPVSEWDEFVSEEAHFQILMPGEPTRNASNINTPAGPIKDITFLQDTDDYSLVVSYIDLSSLGPGQRSVEKFFDAGRDALLRSSRGRLVSEKDLTFPDYTGREIIFDVPRQGRAYYHWYAVGRRLYGVGMLGVGSSPAESDVEEFFRSFKPLK
jgi:hypothetical protein